MPAKKPLVLENQELRVEIDPKDLATHVLVKSTGQTLRMAGGQPDDVWMVRRGQKEWKGFAQVPIALRKLPRLSAEARIAAYGLVIRISLQGPDVLYEIAPTRAAAGAGKPRDVLYPRHFLLPADEGAYATFPLGQGSIIPANHPAGFHHREGYSEADAHWLGGYTGATGYCAIPLTPDDLYLAVDNRPGQPASCFIHWLGSLGELRYARSVRYHFEKGLTYVAQAKHYRRHCMQAGMFRSLEDKAAENPNVRRLVGSPILCTASCTRREKTFQYEVRTFADQASWVEQFRQASGIANAVVHCDGWGYWGYDAMHPDVLPANVECGGAAGLTELSRRVKAAGYLFGLHDQYIDFYAHAPSFDEKLSIVTEDGRPARVNRWCGGLCGHLCYTQIYPFLRRNLYEGVRRVYPMYHNSPSIWKICQPTAYYLDCFCRTVECWSKDHPMTRGEARKLHKEFFQLTRKGQDGQGIVLSCEHPRDFAVPYLDFGWGIGHLSADVITTTGESQAQPVGIPVPLWHLAFHDALCLPHSGDIRLALLYGQAPYFWLRGTPIGPSELAAKAVLLTLHQDVGFAEMTGHQVLSQDGQVQKSAFAGGIEVEVNKADGSYRISAGAARTKGTQVLPQQEGGS
jgi:hypothetical protein